jgi:hypothetical protein
VTPAIKSGSTFARLALKRSSMIPWRIISSAPVDAPVFVNYSAKFMSRSAICFSGTTVSVRGGKGCCGLRISATLAAISRRCSSDRKRGARNQVASGSNQPLLPFLSLLICILVRRNSPRRRRGHEAANPTKLHCDSARRTIPARRVAIPASRTKLAELLGFGGYSMAASVHGLCVVSAF